MSLSIVDLFGTKYHFATGLDFQGEIVRRESLDSNEQTYRAAASFTPQATSALTMITITGSASKTVRVKKILVGGTCTTNAGSFLMLRGN